ncbi:MAG TPA: TetR/AcrR family transcriptional regulator [Acidimicrobiales bacterium]|nr:TetR/AcrR family transcriptional regulator [Acidimicrobiales bacterium]
MSTAAPRPRGRPPRTEDQRAERRVRLVDAAMDAVRRFGPEVSIDQMAEAADVSKPVLYSEFGDKTGLVDAMAVVLAGRVEQTVMARMATGGRSGPEDVIAAIIEALIDLIEGEPDLYSYIVRSLRMRDRGLLDNALVRVIHARAAVIIGGLAEDLAQGDLGILTDGVFGFVFGVLESWMANRQPSKEQLVSTMSAAIRAGLTEVAAQRAAQRAAQTAAHPGAAKEGSD